MSRISPLDPSRGGFIYRLLNWAARRVTGKEMRPLQVLAHNRSFLLPYLGVGHMVRCRTELPAATRALAMQLAGLLNGCDWCVDYGRGEATRLGVPVEKLMAVAEYRTSPLFSAAERAALAYADEATQLGARVRDETFEALKQHFSERAVVELAVAVAAENFFNRLNGPFEMEAQGFCEVPGLARTNVSV